MIDRYQLAQRALAIFAERGLGVDRVDILAVDTRMAHVLVVHWTYRADRMQKSGALQHMVDDFALVASREVLDDILGSMAERALREVLPPVTAGYLVPNIWAGELEAQAMSSLMREIDEEIMRSLGVPKGMLQQAPRQPPRRTDHVELDLDEGKAEGVPTPKREIDL